MSISGSVGGDPHDSGVASEGLVTQGWTHGLEEALSLMGRLMIQRWPRYSGVSSRFRGGLMSQGWPHDLEVASCFRGGHMILRWPCYSGVAT
jgi:hypothetical protein